MNLALELYCKFAGNFPPKFELVDLPARSSLLSLWITCAGFCSSFRGGMATQNWLCCFPNEARAKMGLSMVDKVIGEEHYCPMTRKLEFGSFRGFQVRVWNAAKAQIARLSTSGLLFKHVVVQPLGVNARSALPVLREVDDRRLGQNSDCSWTGIRGRAGPGTPC